MYQMSAYSTGGYSSSSSNCYSGGLYSLNNQYQQLEQIVMDSKESKPEITADATVMYSKGTYMNKTTTSQYFSADDFLITGRPDTEFIQDLEEIKQHVRKAFKLTTGEEFPESHIIIHLLEEPKLRMMHLEIDKKWDDGIQGFSLNMQGRGVNEIFVKKDFLDKTMLTIGHEIGHVMSSTLPDQRDEEAKAFAFSIAWMQNIVKNNIAGLKQCINPAPAKNGLHNIAYDFVVSLLETGIKAMDIFTGLVFGRTSMINKLELIRI